MCDVGHAGTVVQVVILQAQSSASGVSLRVASFFAPRQIRFMTNNPAPGRQLHRAIKYCALVAPAGLR
ncbi:hypothetical protein BH11GEM1_BH11GEM1_12110 [soil metagenome]